MKAIWNDVVIAESDETIHLEGNFYFPLDSLKMEYFKKTDMNSSCPKKGIASYYSVDVDGALNHNSAWFYPYPKESVQLIKDKIAFWKGIIVKE